MRILRYKLDIFITIKKFCKLYICFWVFTRLHCLVRDQRFKIAYVPSSGSQRDPGDDPGLTVWL